MRSLVIIIGLCGLSAFTSGVGLLLVFDQNLGVGLLWVNVILAAAATILLQLLIVHFWSLATTHRWSLPRRFSAASLGMIVSLISAGLASGCYIYLANRSALETYQTRQNADTVVKPLVEFSDTMNSFAVKMDEISIVARRKAVLEERNGGTCFADKQVQKSCGKKCRLRLRHQEEAASSATVARQMSNSAIVIISHLQADQSREGMVEAFKDAKTLASHSDLTAIAAWLKAETVGFRGKFYDEKTSLEFVCRDPELERSMSGALRLITSGSSLPPVPPEPASVGIIDTIAKSYGDGFELALSWIDADANPARRAAVSYSYPGYVVAGLVEFLIIALVLYRAFVYRDRGLDWGPEDEFIRYERPLPAQLRRRYKIMIDLILSLILEDRECWYFARPLDGDNAAFVRRCLEATMILDLPTDRDLDPAVPLADIYPEWVASRAGVHRNARWFALHPLTKKKRAWLRKAARDLMDKPESDLPHPPVDLEVVGDN